MQPDSKTIHRTLTKTVILLVLAAVFTGAPRAAQAGYICATTPGFAEIQSEYAKQFNRLRARNGLPRLDASSQLDAIAADYACVLAKTNHFDHVGPDGSTLGQRAKDGGYPYCSIAENLARGQRSVSRVLIDWSNSPGHYANLMRKGVTEFGLGLSLADTRDGPAPGGIASLSDLARSVRAKEREGKPEALPEGKLVWVLLVGRRC